MTTSVEWVCATRWPSNHRFFNYLKCPWAVSRVRNHWEKEFQLFARNIGDKPCQTITKCTFPSSTYIRSCEQCQLATAKKCTAATLRNGVAVAVVASLWGIDSRNVSHIDTSVYSQRFSHRKRSYNRFAENRWSVAYDEYASQQPKSREKNVQKIKFDFIALRS